MKKTTLNKIAKDYNELVDGHFDSLIVELQKEIESLQRTRIDMKKVARKQIKEMVENPNKNGSFSRKINNLINSCFGPSVLRRGYWEFQLKSESKSAELDALKNMVY